MRKCLLALVALLVASPAAAQVTASLPVTCNAAGTNCVQATPVTNPDGSAVGVSTPGTGASAQQMQGAGPGGSTVTGNPVLVAGSDGTNARTLLTDTGGRVVVTSQAASPVATHGNIANDGVDSGSPVKIGGFASVTAPVAVSDGDRVNAWYSQNGAAIARVEGGPVTGADAQANVYSTPITNNTTAWMIRVKPEMFNGASWDRQRTIQGSDGTGIGITAVATAPTSAATGAIAPVVTSAVASGIVLKATAGNLYGLNVVSGASAGYVLLFAASSVPADGAVTPIKCFPVAANSGVDWNFRDMPIAFTAGISAAFSTTGCFLKTASVTAYISGDVK